MTSRRPLPFPPLLRLPGPFVFGSANCGYAPSLIPAPLAGPPLQKGARPAAEFQAKSNSPTFPPAGNRQFRTLRRACANWLQFSSPENRGPQAPSPGAIEPTLRHRAGVPPRSLTGAIAFVARLSAAPGGPLGCRSKWVQCPLASEPTPTANVYRVRADQAPADIGRPRDCRRPAPRRAALADLAAIAAEPS